MADNKISKKIHVPCRKTLCKTALLAAIFLGTSVLGACSTIPDAVNPAEWYRGTVDLFAGDKAEEKKQEGKGNGLAADRGKAPPGADKPFPNLASVDEKARARDKTGGGLSADPERPKYAPAIKRQESSAETVPVRPSETQAPSTAAAPSPGGPTMPPPKSAPTTPVTPVETTIVSSQPPPMPLLEPPTLTAEETETEARLQKQLADIQAQARTAGGVPPSIPLPIQPGELPTIIVSSEGIRTVGAMAALPVPMGMVPPGAVLGSQLTGAPVVRGTAVKVATILFENGSSKLKSLDRRILSSVSHLQRDSGGTIRIVGHASSRTRNLDPVRHKMANFQISMARADKVFGELIRLGVSGDRIIITAVSDAEPLYHEFMPSGEAGNRRTEVYLFN